MAMHSGHACKCANNVSGVCYGDANACYLEDIAKGRILATACPGYIAPGGTPFAGVQQGSVKIDSTGKQTKV